MTLEEMPAWACVPFAALVAAIAILPAAAPRAWGHRWVHALVAAAASVPVLALYLAGGHARDLVPAVTTYVSFAVTTGTLYVVASGVLLEGDLDPTPRTNVAFVVLGGVLASLVGTTGASLLLVRPFLRANEGRENRAHLVPFFILIVANAGGLLTPLGDPPLLVGYTIGVPFLWTLRLFPVWVLYVGTLALALYVVDRRAHAGETPRRRRPGTPLRLRGARNVALLLAVIPASLLPFGAREGVLTAITLVSLAVTPRDVHVANRFAWGPIAEVSILFAGVFLTLAPVEALLSARAHSLPFARAWQLFWASGTLSSILDSAPTYAAFAAIARGLATGSDRIAGMTPVHLAAISVGTVVMGATTYVGNAPNLLVAAIARGERLRVPSFLRYAAFAFVAMLPAHLVTTLALVLLDR